MNEDLLYVEEALYRQPPESRRRIFAQDARLRLILPEVYRLDGIPQPPRYHPEGDALTHTLLAVAHIPENADRRLAWSALLHDVGKAETTREIRGRIRAFGHDECSAELAGVILERLGMSPETREDVLWLVRNHMFALSWQVESARRLSRPQWRFITDRRFPLLVDLLEIDALASGARPDKLAQADFYRRMRRRCEEDSRDRRG